jgi:L-threonylcarbamoyladenylate synthase
MGYVRVVDQNNPDEEALTLAAEVLKDGGVLVMPTDSVYGIGCVATPDNPGHERIFEIKHRERTQTLPWLIADARDLDRFSQNGPAWAYRLVDAYWPGALTLVVRATGQVPSEYVAANGTLAIRVPDSEFVRELARRLGPLATTSANTHGEAAATSGSGIEDRIVKEADLTLDAGAAPVAIASTIVDCTGDKPKVLREGAIPTTDILSSASA